MTETQFRLGKPVEGEADRDAIHIAVIPVTLVSTEPHQYFRPGQPIKLLAGTIDQASTFPNEGYGEYGYKNAQGDGIIDPFFEGKLEAGTRVWMFLYPNTVKGMRHHWSHPRFDKPEELTEAQTWLRRFADRYGMDYNEMVKQAQTKEGYAVAVGRDLHGSYELDPGDEDDFWKHMETLTGKRFDNEHRQAFEWSCTC